MAKEDVRPEMEMLKRNVSKREIIYYKRVSCRCFTRSMHVCVKVFIRDVDPGPQRRWRAPGVL